MNKYKALITGGTGFVGSNLAKRLVQDGWLVHIIAIDNDNYSQIKEIEKNITVHTHDTSTENMCDIVASVKPDIVLHLASLFLLEHTTSDINRLVQSNILFSLQLLEAMALHGVGKIVNTGTSWQHYENKTYSPVNLYAATKQAFEDILQYYVEAKNISAITLKLFDTYGPNDPRPKLFNLLARVANEGTTLEMSPGEQLIDLVYIDDVVEAFVVASMRLLSGTVDAHEKYGVSSGTAISLKEMISIFSDVTGRPLPIIYGGRPYRTREVMKTCDFLPSLPKWKPVVNIGSGIKNCNNPKQLIS